MEDWPASVLVALIGFLGGVVLGMAARFGRFCTLSAIEDAQFGGDFRRLRMWALAIGVAIVGVAFLTVISDIDFTRSLYHRLAINPVAWVVGGLMFGVGMAFCGTCGYGTLARAGGGDLRALFGFLILGISAYMAIAGPTAELRVAIIEPFAFDRTFPSTLDGHLVVGGRLQVLVGLGVALPLIAWCLSEPGFRSSPRYAFWGTMVGLAVISGWVGTALVGIDPFDPKPLQSHTFSVPLGQTIIYIMTMSTATMSFGIGGTFGVVAGAFIGALVRREFRWEGADDGREMRRHIVGAFLMGTGGVYAGGCTIGQGISAASVLALSAPVVLISIWCGAWLGLSYLMEGTLLGGLRAMFGRRI